MHNLVKLLITGVLFTVTTSFTFKHKASSNYYIIVTKHDYSLTLYDDGGWLVKYPVVFGNKDLGDKMQEGDRETPEGTFTIISKKPHEKWHKFLMLDYPTAESYEKFKQRKAAGLIPQNAQIGGGVGIHGTWPHEEFAVDRYQNWTEGCISMKNEDIDELFKMIPPGTKVIIRK